MPTDGRFYWDSCVFIDLLEQTPEKIDHLRPIIAKAEDKEVQIVTSALTLAEVCKCGNLKLLDTETEKLIASFFENPYISLRSLDRFMAEKTRPIIREFNLQPADAIHVVTAISIDVEVMHTYDEKLLRHDGKINGLKIRRPDDTRLYEDRK